MDKYIDLSAESDHKLTCLLQAAQKHSMDQQQLLALISEMLELHDGSAPERPSIPKLIDTYRTHIWDKISRLSTERREKIKNDQKNSRIRTDYLWHTMFDAIFQKPAEVSSTTKRKIMLAIFRNLHPILFDSYWFFASGHIVVLAETIECLREGCQDYLYVLLVNKNMVLFPELVHLLDQKTSDVAVVYSSDDTFNLAREKQKYSHIDFLEPEPIAFSVDNKTMSIDDGSSINPSIRFLPHCKVGREVVSEESISSIWKNKYSACQSRVFLDEMLATKKLYIRHKKFIVYHARNAQFRWPSVRDSPSLRDRVLLCDTLDKAGIGVVNMGVLEKGVAEWTHPNVIHIGEIGPICSSMQLHAFNAAEAIVGSASGMTLLSSIVDIPCLWIDLAFPMIAWPPRAGYKVLLKQIINSDRDCNLSLYFGCSPEEYLVSDLPEDNPLVKKGYSLRPNTDAQICLAIFELLNIPYSLLGSLFSQSNPSGHSMVEAAQKTFITDAIRANRKFHLNGFSYIDSIERIARSGFQGPTSLGNLWTNGV
jgi:hypothetical protein